MLHLRALGTSQIGFALRCCHRGKPLTFLLLNPIILFMFFLLQPRFSQIPCPDSQFFSLSSFSSCLFACLSQFLKISNSAVDFGFVALDIFLIYPQLKGKLCFEGMKEVPYVDTEKSEKTSFMVVFDKLVKELREPVDFELPDWCNKWTPMPYTSIKRNIYRTKKVRKRLDDDDGIFCSCTPLAGSSSVCGKDCLCGMLFSTCSSGCKCGSSCLNKPFQSRPVKKMKLVKTEKCGSGIVADEDIEQGEFVIEYVGEVIDDKECEQRLWNMKHRGETNFYLCEINRDMVIDATFKGNKSRYINHSCCPNTEMQKWIIDGETRIGIFATRDIKKGEHLTYDYQFVQFGADQDCHCGAVACRRKLGVQPPKPKMASDAALKLVAYQVYQNGGLHTGTSHIVGQQKSSHNCLGQVVRINERFGIIRRFDKYSKKHLIMFDDGTVRSLDMSEQDWELVRV